MAWPVGKSLSPEHKAKALVGLEKARIARLDKAEEISRKQTERLKIRWQNPEYRRKMTELFIETSSKSGFKEAIRQAAKKPERNAKISKALKGKKRRPFYRTESHRARISAALKGKPKSEGHKAALRRHKRSPVHCARIALAAAKRILRYPKPITGIERALYVMMKMSGFTFIPEKRFGRYVVDAYIPELHMAFEADGAFWHKDEERKLRRDIYLKDIQGLVAVVHFNEQDLSHWDSSIENYRPICLI